MVKVGEEYIGQIADSETVFDMAAICYKILEDEISNPIKFISEYMDESIVPVAGNPNHQKLRKFSDKVCAVLERYSELEFPKQRSYIIAMLRRLVLEPFQRDTGNQLSVIYTLLSAIDSMVPFWNGLRIAERTPLNRGKSRDTHFVYLASEKNLHEELILEIGRERKGSADFGEGFSHLLFLKKEMLPKKAQAPEVCFLPCRKRDRHFCLKIAMITGVRGSHFKTPWDVGTSRVIEYIEGAQEKTAEGLWQKMETAILQGAEFIILPEFSVSEEILGYIKKKLAERQKKENTPSDLIAVFPGSTWITSNENEHDNVQIILDAWGKEIGRYYKNSPFRKKSNRRKGYEASEGMSNPGLHTSVLEVEGVGYVLPATCRDVIDGGYTDYLVRKFCPTLLMIPAWSSSGSSFERPLKAYAADYFSNSVLCNGCGALSGNASIVGGAAVLGKKGTVAAGQFEAVKKPDLWKETCRKECDRYCGYLLEINFDPAKMDQKDRISFQSL